MSSVNQHGAFVGIILKGGESVKLDDLPEGALLRLTNACLHEAKDSGKTFLAVSVEEGKAFNVAVLQKDKQEMCGLDFFCLTNQGAELHNKGKNEVHIVGCLEPEDDEHEHDDDCCSDEDGSDLDAMMEGEDSDEDGSEEEDGSEDEEELAKQIIAKLPVGNQANGKKPAKPEKKAEAAKASPATKPQPSPKTGAQPSPKTGAQPSPKTAPQPSPKTVPQAAPAAAPQEKKRKADSQQEGKPEEKKVKTAPAAAVAGGDVHEANYEKAIGEYLKKSGRVNLSELGGKVPKPKEVAKKMGQFIKERPNVFKVENNFVELVKK